MALQCWHIMQLLTVLDDADGMFVVEGVGLCILQVIEDMLYQLNLAETAVYL